MHNAIARILENRGAPLDPDTAKELIPLLPAHRADIYALARLSMSWSKKEVFSCGIINAKSGRCAENCAFCAQSAHYATETRVYSLLSLDKLLERAERLYRQGASYMGIVISGTAPTDKDFSMLCEAAPAIRQRVPIQLCASFGILSFDQAVMLKQAGYASCHHNLETARSWYGRICTTHTYEVREQTVRNALQAGLRVCSGGIFGLGEGWDERLELASTLKALGIDSIPVNFLTPVKGTPLENRVPPSPEEALDIIALLRLMHPEKDIIICGGRALALGDWENTLFLAGANGLMVGDYLTTKGSGWDKDRDMLALLGGGKNRDWYNG